jgi:hypothetical protein
MRVLGAGGTLLSTENVSLQPISLNGMDPNAPNMSNYYFLLKNKEVQIIVQMRLTDVGHWQQLGIAVRCDEGGGCVSGPEFSVTDWTNMPSGWDKGSHKGNVDLTFHNDIAHTQPDLWNSAFGNAATSVIFKG